MAQLTDRKRFRQSFELSEGDIWLPKLFRHTIRQRWPIIMAQYMHIHVVYVIICILQSVNI